MEYLQYVTKEGDRWDNIAFKSYGNPGLSKQIIEANPNILVTATIQGGQILNIPIQQEEEVMTKNELLPPWLQD